MWTIGFALFVAGWVAMAIGDNWEAVERARVSAGTAVDGGCR